MGEKICVGDCCDCAVHAQQQAHAATWIAKNIQSETLALKQQVKQLQRLVQFTTNRNNEANALIQELTLRVVELERFIIANKMKA